MVQIVVNIYNLLMSFNLLQLAIIVIMTMKAYIHIHVHMHYTRIHAHRWIYIYPLQNKKQYIIKDIIQYQII